MDVQRSNFPRLAAASQGCIATGASSINGRGRGSVSLIVATRHMAMVLGCSSTSYESRDLGESYIDKN